MAIIVSSKLTQPNFIFIESSFLLQLRFSFTCFSCLICFPCDDFVVVTMTIESFFSLNLGYLTERHCYSVQLISNCICTYL